MPEFLHAEEGPLMAIVDVGELRRFASRLDRMASVLESQLASLGRGGPRAVEGWRGTRNDELTAVLNQLCAPAGAFCAEARGYSGNLRLKADLVEKAAGNHVADDDLARPAVHSAPDPRSLSGGWGIVFGLADSSIARIDPLGRPEVVQNREGQYRTPSVVLFEPGTSVAVVGQEAKNEAPQSPARVVEFVRNMMGRPGWSKEIDGREYRAEEISALILRKLAEDAEEGTGESVINVVLTVPPHFDCFERSAMQAAGQIAGLNVLEVLDNPVAAAIHYRWLLERSGGRIAGDVLVYDLGIHAFEATVLRVADDEIKVAGAGGSRHLGGRDWDDALIRYVASEFQSVHGVDPLDDIQSLQELRVNCENARHSFLRHDALKVSLSYQGQHGGVDLTVQRFDEITSSLLAQTIELTIQTVAGTVGELGALDHVLLVGESASMAQVGAALRKMSGTEPILFDPDLTVAKGAAIRAQEILAKSGRHRGVPH